MRTNRSGAAPASGLPDAIGVLGRQVLITEGRERARVAADTGRPCHLGDTPGRPHPLTWVGGA